MSKEANLIISTAEMKPDAFWEGVQLPFNDEDPEFELVNPVVAAEWFAKKTADIAQFAGLAEVIEEEIANLKVHKRRAEAKLARFRRRLFADNYKSVTKTADKEIQSAFVMNLAAEAGKAKELENLEDAIEAIVRSIEIREPRRDQFYTRLKSLKDSMEGARQFLDFSKLEMRIEAAANGGRRT